MSEKPSVCLTVLVALENLPTPWTEVLRDPADPYPVSFVDLDVWLDHTDYRARVRLMRDTDGGWDYAIVRCFRKDGQPPTHTEVVRVLGQVFGPHLLVERDNGGGKDHWCEVEYDPGHPCGWNIFDDGYDYDPANNTNNWHLGLQLSLECQPAVESENSEGKSKC